MASEASDSPPKDAAEYDERIDFFSNKFDPLKALNTPGLKAPVADAKVHDNLSKYKSVYNPNVPKPSTSKQSGDSRSKKLDEREGDSNQRRFLPHQMPTKSEKRSFSSKNAKTRMDTMGGPLSLLRKCKDEGLRIKVWTRNDRGLRGYCTAFVVTFDKYWNMTLKDVTEVWTRCKKRKIPSLVEESLKGWDAEEARRLFPKVTVIKTDKKTETCGRHVDELLIRGEQVAYIVVLRD